MAFYQVRFEQRPKYLLEIFNNGNGSATSSGKLARILQTLEASIINSGLIFIQILTPNETLKCLLFDNINIIFKDPT